VAGESAPFNLFLTGPVGAGKSTLLGRLLRRLNWRIGGFRTRPAFDGAGMCGYCIEPFGAAHGAPSSLIARRTDRGFEALTSAFDGLGASLLRKALEDRFDAVVMDEIGFFEERAMAFHDAVMACLDSPLPVLGVLKRSGASLPRKIRGRQDVRVVEVTSDNRDGLLPELLRLVSERHLTGVIPFSGGSRDEKDRRCTVCQDGQGGLCPSLSGRGGAH
jgi:nucleoside-triphosphatase